MVVDMACNGMEAVEMVKQNGMRFYDAILMDIQMPVMDGYTATRNIRAMEDEGLSSVPIIALTANAFAEDEKAAQRAGMQAYVSKPIEVDVLIRTLAEVLQK